MTKNVLAQNFKKTCTRAIKFFFKEYLIAMVESEQRLSVHYRC